MHIYADKLMVRGNSENSRVFNYAILLKSQKFDARKMDMFYSILPICSSCLQPLSVDWGVKSLNLYLTSLQLSKVIFIVITSLCGNLYADVMLCSNWKFGTCYVVFSVSLIRFSLFYSETGSISNDCGCHLLTVESVITRPCAIHCLCSVQLTVSNKHFSVIYGHNLAKFW